MYFMLRTCTYLMAESPPPLIEAEPLCLSRPYSRKPRAVESEAGK
ncbi:MAG: hypothetical protein QOI20_2666 [Acidimicrobiaceae bacterium]|jgi:hypothetical protein|nr:hypothetical protein [Acidimicrobiaceae bacterium]